MSETKHTPGPWYVEQGHEMKDNGTYWQVHDGHDAICCNQFCYADNSESNAHLIAAAPELLEALKETLDVATRSEVGEFADRARVAIAKADGRL